MWEFEKNNFYSNNERNGKTPKVIEMNTNLVEVIYDFNEPVPM